MILCFAEIICRSETPGQLHRVLSTPERKTNAQAMDFDRGGNDGSSRQTYARNARNSIKSKAFAILWRTRLGLARTFFGMKLLGLTGGIACGKSTLAAWLRQKGAAIIDADQLVHELYSDLDFAAKVAAFFDEEIRDDAGHVARGKLSTLVFGNAEALQKLEAFVHPAVADLCDEKLRALLLQNQPPQVAVLEAVKLIESGQANRCDEVWCVSCKPETQLQRLVENRHLSEDQARARLASQPDFELQKIILSQLKISLICLQNDGSLEQIQAAAEQHWNQLIA